MKRNESGKREYQQLPGTDGEFDVVVIGAGHAGCEAALASARIGAKTLLLTMQPDMLAHMPCNPAIGGTAKGILVREIDAMGGAMGRITDIAGLHFRILNTSRGPAVQSPRVQCDKREYTGQMKWTIEKQEHLFLRQDTATGLEFETNDAGKKRIEGVTTAQGFFYRAKAVVICAGTFMKGRIHIGTHQRGGGRAGEAESVTLSDSLRDIGLDVERFKTGTPPRILGRSIDFSKLEPQPPDDPPRAVSHFTDPSTFHPRQRNCWMTWTNPDVHRIVQENLHRAPLFDGQIKTTGPRYCPSFEIKIVRFEDRDRHQIILEPEGRDCEEYYLNGFSTSIPADVQYEAIRKIPGLEHAEIMRFGYAIEYDFVPPNQIRHTLETRICDGLFLAGQVNGTSGYEEAAAQGLLAGANAALKVLQRDPLVIRRDEGYLGVLVDDLISRDVPEPYRLFTSRAEFRLMLRMDNALYRLGRKAAAVGLLDEESRSFVEAKCALRDDLLNRLKTERHGGKSLFERLQQTQKSEADSWAEVFSIAQTIQEEEIPPDLKEHLFIEARYAGYIRRQETERKRLARMEGIRIPEDLDYSMVASLKIEARETFESRRPATLAQASRLPGVTPADISALAIHLSKKK